MHIFASKDPGINSQLGQQCMQVLATLTNIKIRDVQDRPSSFPQCSLDVNNTGQ